MSLLEHLRLAANHQPQALSLLDAEGSCTRSQLWSRIARCADALQHAGVCRLSSQLDNSTHAVVLDLGARLAGVVHLPLPLFFTPAQVAHAQASAGVDAHASAAAPDHGWMLDSAIRVTRVQAHGPPPDIAAATALITYTSGSTGTPKGVCLSADHLDQVARAIVDGLAGATPQRHLCLLPLSILLEQVAGVWSALYADATVLLPPLAQTGLRGAAQLDALQLADCIEQQRPESLILVPQMLQAWVAALAGGARAPDSLRFVAVGGARVGAQLLASAARLGLPVFEGYGLSECGSVVCLNRPDERRAGTVGQPLPHMRVELDGDGEILLHGPRFLGYVGGETPPNGPYRTGDLGALDSDGYLSISGRKRNVFITAFGRNVSPEWVESELCVHPLIAQAVVQGEARASNCAVLVPRDGNTSDAAIAAAVRSVNAGLPDYARVHHWVRANAAFTPLNQQLTDNGRVRREQVLAHYAAAIERNYLNQGEKENHGLLQ